MSGWLRHWSRADRTAPISKRFLLPNITYILIINQGRDSSTSQLVSIRFKYLRLKKHLNELRTCSECKNRYAKHTCIKPLSHGAIFLATCNAIHSTLGRCKIGKYTFPSQFANIFLFVTNLHLLRVARIALQVARKIAPCDRAFSASCCFEWYLWTSNKYYNAFMIYLKWAFQ